MLYGKSSARRIGVVYLAPTLGCSIKNVGILVGLSLYSTSTGHQQIGIVRYTIHSKLCSRKDLDGNGFKRFCSCMTIENKEKCLHILLCDSSDTNSMFKVILCSKDISLEVRDNKAGLKSILFGDRSNTTFAIWMVCRSSIWNGDMPNLIPIIENRNSLSSKIISRSVRCARCSRISGNRGVCEHEDVTVRNIRVVDGDRAVEPQILKKMVIY